MTTTRPSHLLAAGLLAVLSAACGGSSSSNDLASDPTSAPAVAASSAAAAPSPKASACEAVPKALLDSIASGAEKDVGTLTLTNGKAYRSADYKSVFFVAAHLSAPGVKDEVGVWATNSLTSGGGLILAADGFAKQFTVWPDADKSAAKISGGDPAIDKAKDCVG